MEKEVWQNPKKEHTLDEAQTPLWFWNDKLEKEELQRQLKMQTEVGITCTNPHARTNKGEGYIGGYLDEQWFEDIKTVLDYKKEHGEKMWLYDEINWPAGTCNQTITLEERNREQYITIERIEIPVGNVFRAQIQTFEGKGLSGIKPETDKSQLTYNIVIIDKKTAIPYDIAEYFIYDRFGPELEFQAECDCVAFLTKIQITPYEYGGNVQVNYLDDKVTQQFLTSTYDKYYQHFGHDFGKTITTVFSDETRMCHPIPWSRGFVDAFLKQKGYDVRKVLYQVILTGEKAGRVRCDYYDVVARLFQENYFGEIHKWCQAHEIKLFAHLLGEETMVGHTRYSGDYLRQNRFQDVCGADHLGKGIGSLNIKFTACGAHSYGKKHTAVEVFAGCGWDMTFEEYSRIIVWLFQQGMQIIINHGFFYSDRGNRKNDWPPSQFFQWQGWPKQAKGNDMIRRLNYAMTGGVNEADILVYFPIESFWLHYLPNQHYTHGFFHGPFTEDDKAASLDKEIQLILNGLLSENLDFDLIHQDAIENFLVRDGKIVNIKSGQKFSALLLPMCEILPVSMAKLCEQFGEQGGKVIMINERPRLGMTEKNDSQIEMIIKRMEERGQITLCSTADKEQIYQLLHKSIPHPVKIVKGTRKTINNHPAYPNFLIDPYMHSGEDLCGIMFNRYLKEGKRNTLFMNYGNTPDTIEVRIVSSGTVPEIWNTFTGEIEKAEVINQDDQSYAIRLTLPCNYGLLVVSDL